jgi:hypothetical protein
MVDFAQNVRQFSKGWKNNEPRRRKLLSDLMEIIWRYAYRRFGCVIENKLLVEKLPKDQRGAYYLDAYSLAGRDCAAQVSKWCKTEKITGPVQFVFEDGDLGKGNLIKRFEADLYPSPAFKYKKDTKTQVELVPAFTPLQAADFLAYEVFVGCKDMDERKRKPRWGVEEFLKMPGNLGIYEPENLEEMSRNLRVAKATLESWKKIYGKKS